VSPHTVHYESVEKMVPELPTPRAKVKVSFEKDALISFDEYKETLEALESLKLENDRLKLHVINIESELDTLKDSSLKAS
jgi:hypothetical protein